METPSPQKPTLDSILKSRTPIEQMALLDRMLADPELPAKARVPLQDLRSLAKVRAVDAARAAGR